MRKAFIFQGVVAVLAFGAVAAAPQVITSPAVRTTMIELYTSEGCSSCPPADAWLSGLKDDPRLWREIVPVAFHVDYWDYLGWKDRFAKPGFSARQQWYAGRKHVRTVYTPGVMRNGREWRGWRFASLDPAQGRRVGVLRVDVKNGGLSPHSSSPPNRRERSWCSTLPYWGSISKRRCVRGRTAAEY